jgi:hypothetical protein
MWELKAKSGRQKARAYELQRDCIEGNLMAYSRQRTAYSFYSGVTSNFKLETLNFYSRCLRIPINNFFLKETFVCG